ncbi:MAG: orotate phosphoribosyltransferase [Planctomycetes bacterium]|nr:orotate phosphoribosyltransferase [Planctomycetota bacterium]NOG53788.1 orotate phosphoribosyltransferase [Planctomycetota bacterium]
MTRPELMQRIVEQAVLRGTFTLRSGRTSNYYLDKYLLSCQPSVLRSIATGLAERIDVAAVNRLAGAELGGIPLVTAVALETGLPCVFVRNQRKDYGTSHQIEGRLEDNDRVLLIEDVATTGGQAIEAAGDLAEAGATVVGILAVIDRLEGARENVEAAGYPFDALFTVSELGLIDGS